MEILFSMTNHLIAHILTYTREFKENVVKEYLDGKGSIESLQIKYKILNHSTLRNRIVRIIIFGVQSNQKCII